MIICDTLKGVLKYEHVKLKEVGLPWSIIGLEPWSVISNVISTQLIVHEWIILRCLGLQLIPVVHVPFTC